MINWKRIFVEAVAGFVGWTAFLTPYMIFVVRTDAAQYLAWFAMQLILVPPIAPIVIKFTNFVTKKLKVNA
jgi:hypothetical protein